MKLDTNRKIIILQDKVLKLNHVLSKELSTKELKEQGRSLQIIQGNLKARGLKIIGPYITHIKLLLKTNLLLPL